MGKRQRSTTTITRPSPILPGCRAQRRVVSTSFPPTVTQGPPPQPGGDTAQFTGVLFPLGLYVGTIIVSASRLTDKENSLEIAIRAFNGTGKALRVVFVEGVIKGTIANLRDSVELPQPVWKTEHTAQPIEPNTEFIVVLDQRVSPNLAAVYLETIEDSFVSLDLRSLIIKVEVVDNPANRARLPLWDGLTLRRRNDVFTGRIVMMSGSASIGFTSKANLSVDKAKPNEDGDDKQS